MQNKSLKIAVCAICRNEVDYIEEWVSFYKVAGFDSIYIYDNVSDDGSSELLSSLDAAGQIVRVHWPRKEGVPPQRDAYGDFLHSFAQNYDYVLVCDLDGFLVVADSDIKSLIVEAETKHGDVGAIGFPWLLFGSGGAEDQEQGLVIERFTNCEAKVVRTVKTLYCSRNTYNMRTHICDLISGKYLDNRLEVAKFDMKMPIKLKSASSGKAVMHHYYTKSESEWMRRRSQPKADRAKIELKNIEEFERFKSLSSYECSAKDQADNVRRVIADMKDARSELESGCATAQVQLVAINNDWLFGIVTGLEFMSPLSVRLAGDEGQETIFYTKPISNRIHGFCVKTKWRKYHCGEFSISVIGSRNTQLFTRSDYPSVVSSIELMNKYMPSAEQHIFSTFLNSLTQRPTAKLMEVVKSSDFKINEEYSRFCRLLEQFLDDENQVNFIEGFNSLHDSTKSFIKDAKGALFIKALVG